jgi:hypothetical protein
MCHTAGPCQDGEDHDFPNPLHPVYTILYTGG